MLSAPSTLTNDQSINVHHAKNKDDIDQKLIEYRVDS